MKIKLFVIAALTFLILLLFGNFSVKSNDVYAASNSVTSVQDDLEYVRELRDGQWWIVVYDGGEPIAEYPDDD